MSDDFDFLSDRIKQIYEEGEEISITDEENDRNEVFQFVDYQLFNEEMKDFVKVYLNNHKIEDARIFELNISMQPPLNKKFDLLAETLINKQNYGYQTYVLSNSNKQLERLQEILQSEEVSQQVEFLPVNSVVHSGFSDNDIFLTVFTDHQIFGRYHKYKLKTVSIVKSKEAQILQEIRELKPGDYIVHQDFGIGIFKGLKTIENNGSLHEVVHIVYKDNDNLFVNVHSLYKISKYKSKDAEPPANSILSRFFTS
jgi:transcription-repair coupling factor (superfamily II helicase)